MKIDDYLVNENSLKELSYFADDVKTILNFGKYQFPIVSAAPNWAGRRGEAAIMISGSTGRFYVCTSDNTTNHWVNIVTFTP